MTLALDFAIIPCTERHSEALNERPFQSNLMDKDFSDCLFSFERITLLNSKDVNCALKGGETVMLVSF